MNIEERYQRKFQEYYKELFTYKGRKIADTDHTISQFNKRFPEYTFEDWKEIIEKGIDTILDVFKDNSAKYVIISKSKNIAIQVEWRKDNKYNDKKNHAFSATTLDYKIQKRVIQGDTKLFVENFEKFSLKESIKDIGYYAIYLEECKGYKVYIKEGKIYRNFISIEI